jgi:hypothetical protein
MDEVAELLRWIAGAPAAPNFAEASLHLQT